jgi:neutral ceramidase
MRIGLSQIDITPPVGIDLGGYAARIQPSVAVMDTLALRGIYLQDSNEKLLWLHADVIALSGDFVDSFRAWASKELGLPPNRILLSATHTHAGPVTVCLTACGNTDAQYLQRLRESFERAARAAVAKTQACSITTATGECQLAIDRRKKPSAHTDPVVSAVGFRDGAGNFLAVIANYAMHPTSLGHTNRAISSDWPGYAADVFTSKLPGHPIALMTNGACGNINPPKQNVTQEEVRTFGQKVAESVIQKLAMAPNAHPHLRVAVETVPIALDIMSPAEIDAAVDANIAKGAGDLWARQWIEANESWRRTQKQLVQSGRGATVDIELFAIALGPITILAINGEIFSRFTTTLRESTSVPLFTVTYANRAFGYIPTLAAYDEGGYEVEQAHFFYNTFRPKPGALEYLAEHAAELVRSVNLAPDRATSESR